MRVLPITLYTASRNVKFREQDGEMFNSSRQYLSPYQQELEDLNKELHNRIRLIHYYYSQNNSAKENALKRLFQEIDLRKEAIEKKYAPKKNWLQKLLHL